MDRPWERLNHALRRLVRRIIGKQPELSLGIMDNQIVKATGAGSEQGYDDGKKMNERKRHILIDTFGLLLVLVVHAANIQDYDGA